MSFNLTLSQDATFKSQFERNHAEAIANHEATRDEFLKGLWARQMVFWARMVRTTSI